MAVQHVDPAYAVLEVYCLDLSVPILLYLIAELAEVIERAAMQLYDYLLRLPAEYYAENIHYCCWMKLVALFLIIASWSSSTNLSMCRPWSAFC